MIICQIRDVLLPAALVHRLNIVRSNLPVQRLVIAKPRAWALLQAKQDRPAIDQAGSIRRLEQDLEAQLLLELYLSQQVIDIQNRA